MLPISFIEMNSCRGNRTLPAAMSYAFKLHRRHYLKTTNFIYFFILCIYYNKIFIKNQWWLLMLALPYHHPRPPHTLAASIRFIKSKSQVVHHLLAVFPSCLRKPTSHSMPFARLWKNLPLNAYYQCKNLASF